MKDRALATCKAKAGHALEKYTLWNNISQASREPKNLFTCGAITERTKPAPHGGAWWKEKNEPAQTETSEVQPGCK